MGISRLPDVIILSTAARDLRLGPRRFTRLRGVDSQIRRNENSPPSWVPRARVIPPDELLGLPDKRRGGEYWLNGQKVSDAVEMRARIRKRGNRCRRPKGQLLTGATSLHKRRAAVIPPAGSKGDAGKRAAPSLEKSAWPRPECITAERALSGRPAQRVAICRDPWSTSPRIIRADAPRETWTAPRATKACSWSPVSLRRGRPSSAHARKRDIAASPNRQIPLKDGRERAGYSHQGKLHERGLRPGDWTMTVLWWRQD